MLGITVVLEGDGALADWSGRAQVEISKSELIRIVGLERGLESGKPSVAIAIPLEDGDIVFAQTSLALFLAAAEALKGRYGDPRDEKWTST